MSDFRRYAVYYAPRPGAFADLMAAWLGWDVAAGRAVALNGPAGLPRPQATLITAPRKYGFHGTIRAPFRLAAGHSPAALRQVLQDLAGGLQPVVLPGLQLRRLGGFLALVPLGDRAGLLDLGAAVVRATDPLRAALCPEEIARRHPERLTPRQRELLETWGYPHVMEEFRFHLTLSDTLSDDVAAALEGLLAPWLAPDLPHPFVLEDLCLFGEDAQGRFHLLDRYALRG